MMNDNMSASTSALSSIDSLLKDAWSRFTKRWKFFALYSLVSVIAPGAIMMVGGLLATILGAGSLFAGGKMAFGGSAIAMVLFVVAVIAAIYVSILFTVGLMHAVMDENMNSIKAAVVSAKPKAAGAFIVTLITGLLVMIGFVLFVLPGVYLAVCYAFATWVFVAEGKRGMDALRGSKELVAGRWFGVFGRLLVFGIVIWLAMVIPQLVLGALKLSALSFIYNMAASIVIAPISTIFVYNLYKNLKATKTTTTSTIA